MFKFLKEEGDSGLLIPAAEKHLETLYRLRDSFSGEFGEEYVKGYIDSFSATGSPFVVNLDLNASKYAGNLDRMISASEEITDKILETVRATAKNVSGYKMNEQSMLTFLVAGRPRTVERIKEIYVDETGVEPVIWTDEKLRDIPSTTFQTASIIYTLGYDVIHCMPQLGQDVSGALQLAAQKFGKGTIHVINLTHPGYKGVKEDYFKDVVGTIDLMRERALGSKTRVEIGKDKHAVDIRATGTIEPANRPDELFYSMEKYGDRIMVVSIGIGPQGALPGCALYAGAHVEGIGRFIFERGRDFETIENMAGKSRACKRGCLRALGARYSEEAMSYPLEEILGELEGYEPLISPETKKGLDNIYNIRRVYGHSRPIYNSKLNLPEEFVDTIKEFDSLLIESGVKKPKYTVVADSFQLIFGFADLDEESKKVLEEPCNKGRYDELLRRGNRFTNEYNLYFVEPRNRIFR